MSVSSGLKFTIYFVGSGGQLSQVCDLRPRLSYLEHCKCRSFFVKYNPKHQTNKSSRDQRDLFLMLMISEHFLT